MGIKMAINMKNVGLTFFNLVHLCQSMLLFPGVDFFFVQVDIAMFHSTFWALLGVIKVHNFA